MNLARPIGRNQTKARIALVSLGVGIGLDQPTVRRTANNAKKRKSRACMAGAPDLRRCRGNRRLRYLRYSRFRFLASMRYPTRHDPCGKRFRRTARHGQAFGKKPRAAVICQVSNAEARLRRHRFRQEIMPVRADICVIPSDPCGICVRCHFLACPRAAHKQGWRSNAKLRNFTAEKPWSRSDRFAGTRRLIRMVPRVAGSSARHWQKLLSKS